VGKRVAVIGSAFGPDRSGHRCRAPREGGRELALSAALPPPVSTGSGSKGASQSAQPGRCPWRFR
jgi:hypothetical protein